MESFFPLIISTKEISRSEAIYFLLLLVRPLQNNRELSQQDSDTDDELGRYGDESPSSVVEFSCRAISQKVYKRITQAKV